VLERGRLVLRFWTRPGSAAEDKPRDEPADVVSARAYWEIVWERFRGDRASVLSAGFLLVLLLVCFAGEPIAASLLGHGPNDIFPLAADVNRNLLPAGPWSWVPDSHGVITVTPQTPRTLFILGADGPLGRDVFLRVLDGGRTSLELAFAASGLAIALGALIGMLSGYYKGWVDAVATRFSELIMGFPILLFLVALGWAISERLSEIRLGGVVAPGVVSLALVVGVFYCFYPARLVRSQVLSLREQEFVEAARMVGASDFRIMRKHLLPHVAGSLVVYATQLIALTIFLEAALAILGVGIELPYATWGNIIATNYGTLLAPGGPHTYTDSAFLRLTWLITLWPSLLLFLAVVSLTLVGEGVRNAVDPRAKRT
jgi:ABC-type dipeptide/oligopeptide/nickel transport system permease subunit